MGSIPTGPVVEGSKGLKLSAYTIDPFGDFRRECEVNLRKVLEETLVNNTGFSPSFRERVFAISLEVPTSPAFGELSSSVCFEIARKLNIVPKGLAEKIVENMDLSETLFIKEVRAVNGYINFYVDGPTLSRLTLDSARFTESYGHVRAVLPHRIIVEHTSVNPAGPIHIGTARNSILGDSLSRLLRARGHQVATHFYVDDVGRQIAVLVYGYKLLDEAKPTGKADHWVGLVYAITSCIIEIERTKRKLKELEGDESLHEEANKTRLDLDDWISAAADLKEKNRELFESLINVIMKDPDPGGNIATLMRLYEKRDLELRRTVREVVEFCLDGFKQTYDRIGVLWDSWDWESDLIWNGMVSDLLNKLQKSPHCITKDGALMLDVNTIADELQLKKDLGIPEEHEIPYLVLARFDGTTLYPTRDIAYSLWKLDQANKVINVIGVEQTLAQLQIRIALNLLVTKEKAESLIHYAYELVKMPGHRMSKRRGRYVTFDEVIDEATKRAFIEVKKRSPDLPLETKKRISEAVGIGAVKYALIDVAPSKQVTFTWENVLNFEKNSAPFIQYAYARACNIVDKVDLRTINPDYSLLKETIELELVGKVARFPETFIAAADCLLPSLLTEFTYSLAARFNSFYASLPVLKAEPIGLRDARLSLVEGVRITLKKTLDLLGIEALEKM